MFQTKLKTAFTLLFLTLTLMASLLLVQATPTKAAGLTGFSSTPDFSLTMNPTSRTVKRGSGTLYDIDVQALNGFNGTVNFTITGLCPNCFIPSTFEPNPVTGTGVSTFAVQTQKVITPQGTFTLTIHATSGSLSHTTTATLIVE